MDEPLTEAGKALLKREDMNSRSFPLITAEMVRAVEREARRSAFRCTHVPSCCPLDPDSAPYTEVGESGEPKETER